VAISKEIVIDRIEVLELGQIHVRQVTRVLEDGVVLSSAFHRHILTPVDRRGFVKARDAIDEVKDGDGNVTTIGHDAITGAAGTWADTDISGEDARVRAVCNATWTTEVIAAYKAMVIVNDNV